MYSVAIQVISFQNNKANKWFGGLTRVHERIFTVYNTR